MAQSLHHKLRRELFEAIDYVCDNKEDFVNDPSRDFVRERKLSLRLLLEFILALDGLSNVKTILNFFSFKATAPTNSALVQQRSKLKYEALEYLFRRLTKNIPCPRKFKGYRLIACDGSCLRTAYNPEDKETFKHQSGEPGYNALHLTVCYDVLNHIYIDICVQGEANYNESRALSKMVDKMDIDRKTIIIADRGFESYNTIAHIENKCSYAIRIKNNKNGIISGLNVPEGEFDEWFCCKLTHKQAKKYKQDPLYKFIPTNVKFDYLNEDTTHYPIKFRVVKFKISEDGYETIITNLDRSNFPPEVLKEIYHLRWGIETSFRDLKYSVGLKNLHAKKPSSILQEIFAGLTVYNFSQAIITHANRKKECKKLVYQINVTRAIHICKHFLRKGKERGVDIEELLRREMLPIRPGRRDKRKLRVISFTSFLYRVA